MRYAQIKAFHHVALHGGFSRAAAALNQSQPSLSDQVRKLEQAHDVLLFHRDARQIRLTEAGEALLRLTRAFFEAEERIGGFLDRSRAAVTGTLRILADSARHVTPLIAGFRKAHPDVFVTLHTGNTDEVLRGIRSYEAEIGVVANLTPAADLDAVDLGATQIIAIAAAGAVPDAAHRMTLGNLTQHPLVFREPGSRTRAAIEAAVTAAHVVVKPAIVVEGREAMREVVASGAGIGFISEAELGPDPRLRALRIDGVSLTMSESVVSLSARRDVRVIRAFLAQIQR